MASKESKNHNQTPCRMMLFYYGKELMILCSGLIVLCAIMISQLTVGLFGSCQSLK